MPKEDNDEKKCFLIIAFFFILGIFGSANANLVSYSEDAIIDTATGQLWWKDLSDFSNKTYAEQIVFISNLPGGVWHMATFDDMFALFGAWVDREDRLPEIADMFNPVYISAPGIGSYGQYFSGRYDTTYEPLCHDLIRFDTYHVIPFGEDWSIIDGYTYVFAGQHTEDSWSVNNFGSWATTAVPIPTAVWLLGSGLIGIVGIRRKISFCVSLN